MAITRVRTILNRNKEMKRVKEPWIEMYRIIGEYVMLRKQEFGMDLQPGAFLTDSIFDSTAPEANDKMGASLLGGLWPNGSKSFKYLLADGLELTTERKEFFEKATKTAATLLDDTSAGLAVALEEYMRDQGGFGTSGIAVFERDNKNNPLSFKAWDVKGMCIAEGPDGLVDTVYNEKSMTLRQAVIEYGYDALSAKMKEVYSSGKTEEKIVILHAIEPRLERDPFSFGNKDMPTASIHIEVESGKILRESGFDEMPVFVTRFAKAMGEIQGRSPSMKCIADIMELNTLWEIVTIALEKQMDPPLAVYEDGSFGGGSVDTSPGAITPVAVGGRLTNQKPIWQIQTVGDVRSAEPLITKLETSISNAFLLDRLLDFNNETRMTAYETSVRERFRGESVGSVYKRQETEMFTPMLNRVFHILFNRGRLGVTKGSKEELELISAGITPNHIPEDLVDIIESGRDFYTIQYNSPAARAMQAEEVQGLMTTFNFAGEAAAVAPQAIDNIDVDAAIKRIAKITGVSTEILNASDKVKRIREVRAQAQEASAQAQQMEQSSKVAMNMAQAQAMSTKVDQNTQQ